VTAPSSCSNCGRQRPTKADIEAYQQALAENLEALYRGERPRPPRFLWCESAPGRYACQVARAERAEAERDAALRENEELRAACRQALEDGCLTVSTVEMLRAVLTDSPQVKEGK
jgi:hypothetical protein